MSRRACKFTEAEIRRATKVAQAQGMAVRVADDGIWIVPAPGDVAAAAEQLFEPNRRIVF